MRENAETGEPMTDKDKGTPRYCPKCGSPSPDAHPRDDSGFITLCENGFHDAPAAPKPKAPEDCPGCTDPKSEGTHSEGTRQHPKAPQPLCERCSCVMSRRSVNMVCELYCMSCGGMDIATPTVPEPRCARIGPTGDVCSRLLSAHINPKQFVAPAVPEADAPPDQSRSTLTVKDRASATSTDVASGKNAGDRDPSQPVKDGYSPGQLTEADAPRSQYKEAFKEAMGAIDMPEDGTSAYDEWLFNRGWRAGLAELREHAPRPELGQTCPTCGTDIRCIHGKLFSEKCEPCEAPDLEARPEPKEGK